MANELCMHFTDTTEQINIPGSLKTIRHNNIDVGDKACGDAICKCCKSTLKMYNCRWGKIIINVYLFTHKYIKRN